ncbi:MAG: SHOCT domain-containing protein [bacterium]
MATPAVPPDTSSDRGVYDSIQAIRSLLIPGEELEACAVQRRVFALFHRRTAVGATSGRLIIIRRGMFGGFDPQDFRWQDLYDTSLKVGVFAATLTVAVYRSNDLATQEGVPAQHIIEGLRKTEAQEVYRACQARAQAWREKRRIRELEELRAKAGGIQIGSQQAAGMSGASSNDDSRSPTARLQRAKEMLESGLLNDAEFEQIKAKILAEL